MLLCMINQACAVDAPFAQGYSMGNLGTIAGTVANRQPWTSAARLSDTAGFGFAAHGTFYYDLMDNLPQSSIRRIDLGGWYACRQLLIKGAVSYFNTCGIYAEQTGFLSAGTGVIPFVNISISVYGTRYELLTASYDKYAHTSAAAGFSIAIPFPLATIVSSIDNITLKNVDQEGFNNLLKIKAAVHTSPNRFGAQGFVLQVEPQRTNSFTVAVGEEINLTKNCAVALAVSTNPLLVSAGVTILWQNQAAWLALVNHTVLGWSKGAGMAINFKKDSK